MKMFADRKYMKQVQLCNMVFKKDFNYCNYNLLIYKTLGKDDTMPYISTKTTVKLSNEKCEAIKAKLGKAIELIPGKSENWLILSFDDESTMYFKGRNDKPLAFVEVKIFGKASRDAYNKLTREITDILHEELNIQPDCIYVKYEEVANWGWNGGNF